ncbi:MAG TPA: hypothetical protein PLJ88_04900, partial [Agitococcus sp.]|nr:hypothetical protein [Agitococcus sp.]
ITYHSVKDLTNHRLISVQHPTNLSISQRVGLHILQHLYSLASSFFNFIYSSANKFNQPLTPTTPLPLPSLAGRAFYRF